MDGIQIHNVRSLDADLDEPFSGSDMDSLGSSFTLDDRSETSHPNTPEKTEKKKQYPKPPFSYSTLAGLAFKNCFYGNVPVSSVYAFIIKHFPYYKNAAAGWKNSIRHNLSMNKCFTRLTPENGTEVMKSKKGMLWTLTPDRVEQMEQVIQKVVRLNRAAVLASMRYPQDLECVLAGRDYEGNVKFYNSFDEDSEDETLKVEAQSEKTFVFTQFKDGVLPLVTLYSKTPALHAKFSVEYPVIL